MGTKTKNLPDTCTELKENCYLCTRLLTSDIKTYFEVNKHATEVLIFKGRKRLSVNRRLTLNPAFYSVLKKMYEK